MPNAEPQTEIRLAGLDPANPLGYLATLGTLALIERQQVGATLHWINDHEGHRPVLRSTLETVDAIAEVLLAVVQADFDPSPPPWTGHPVVKRPRDAWRELADRCVRDASAEDRLASDLAAALASEAATEEKTDLVTPTAFSFANGQGGKNLLADAAQLSQESNAEAIRDAIASRWSYSEKTKQFRWDPQEFRSWALRADEPTPKNLFGSKGANLLGFYGLSLLPSFPRETGLATTAMTKLENAGGGRATAFTWPLWSTPLSIDPARSILATEELQKKEPNASLLRSRGFTAVFRSVRHVTPQLNVHFLPSQQIF